MDNNVPYIVELTAQFFEECDGKPTKSDDPEVEWEGFPEFLIAEGVNPQKYLGLKFEYEGKRYYGLSLDVVNAAWRLYRKQHPFVAPTLEIEGPRSNVDGTQLNKGKRTTLFGQPITAILRWMGKELWDYDDARTALNKLGISPAEPTIRIQLRAGRTGERGEPAQLTSEDISVLYEALS